jgi:hypothetical protein
MTQSADIRWRDARLVASVGLGASRDDPNGALKDDALRPLMAPEKCFECCPHFFSLLLRSVTGGPRHRADTRHKARRFRRSSWSSNRHSGIVWRQGNFLKTCRLQNAMHACRIPP